MRSGPVRRARGAVSRFGVRGRFALGVALLIHWVAAALFAPTSTLLVALLTALLGASILLDVFKGGDPLGPPVQLSSWSLVR